MISLLRLIWELKSLRISLLILNCEWKKPYECFGTILRNEIDNCDMMYVCVIWPWGPWCEEIPRPGGLENGDADFTILRLRLRWIPRSSEGDDADFIVLICVDGWCWLHRHYVRVEVYTSLICMSIWVDLIYRLVYCIACIMLSCFIRYYMIN